MKILPAIVIVSLVLALSFTVLANQGRAVFDGDENSPALANSGEKGEWAFARLHYTMNADFGMGFRGFQRWAADYPKADRQFVMGVRRLTRLHSSGIEHIVDPNTDDMFDWPWIYVEDGGWWIVSEAQAARMRQYLLRGGFMMIDDSHGDYEWDRFIRGMDMILPDRPVEDLKNADEIFHIMYDLDDRFQIPGTRFIWGNRPYTPDSRVPQWRAIRDDTGRIMVAICHNSDVGDAWEWADSPRYPEKDASLAYRIGINYILYGMTH